jgi:hypothetical protein
LFLPVTAKEKLRQQLGKQSEFWETARRLLSFNLLKVLDGLQERKRHYEHLGGDVRFIKEGKDL